MEESITQKRIRELLVEREISQNECSRRAHDILYKSSPEPRKAKYGLGLVRDILSGKTRSPRTDSIAAIAEALSVSPEYLLGRIDTYYPSLGSNGMTLTVDGVVAAGAWMEESVIPGGSIHYPLDARIPSGNASAWRVENDSVNDLIGPGGYVIAAPASEITPRDGSIVIIERINGDLMERSVRRIERSPSGLEAHAPTNNPRYRPVRLTGFSRTATEEIIAVVVGAIRSIEN